MQDNKEVISEISYLFQVALYTPFGSLFEYKYDSFILPGSRVIVPFGKKYLIGIVLGILSKPSIDESLIKSVSEVLVDLPPFDPNWIKLIKFTSEYYQRPMGEVINAAIPSPLRNLSFYKDKDSIKSPILKADLKKINIPQFRKHYAHELNEQQKYAVDTIKSFNFFKVILLHGITGSGKTEVYLQSAISILNKGKQVLFLVPEINLTPQLENSIRSYFSNTIKQEEIVLFHSSLSIQLRVRAWADIQRSRVRVILGTRMVIFTPIRDIGLIIIDEEHDLSYKQQSGLRYSARDIAIWRAKDLNIPIVLGSATPSLETWHHVEKKQYYLLSLSSRAKNISIPSVRLINTKNKSNVLSEELLDSIRDRLIKKEQSLIFINRRGYAPVFYCYSCNWISNCPRCSIFTVLHNYSNNIYRLNCHHCGYSSSVPKICPECGNQDLRVIGCGTQKLEESLCNIFPDAKIVRMDADTTKRKGSADLIFSSVHNGEVDILIGTQMIAKGHDFSMVTLVGVVNSDSMLFSQDFRASERLFAQLMQVAGRAGRHRNNGEVIVQTGFPEHSVYQYLLKSDYIGFADNLLKERKKVCLPPYSFQVLITAESKKIENSLNFLYQIKLVITNEISKKFSDIDKVFCYDPLPAKIVRISNFERAQLLIESKNRSVLLSFVKLLIPYLSTKKSNKLKWYLEVDPLEI